MTKPKREKDNAEGILERFEPLPLRNFEWLAVPLRAWFAPKLVGEENIDPSVPSLWVGNHTIYGLVDIPVFATELYLRHGIYLRGLADSNHFMVPGWRDTLVRLGAVRGSRPNCKALMENKEHVLVFPGGGREVTKRKGERYKLIWKNRTGFARMAIEHGYPISPFASVGAEEAYNILIDANDIMASPIGTLLARIGATEKYLRSGEAIPPLARGLGPTLLPRPERFYFGFGERIDTTQYDGRADDEDALYDLRDRVRDSVRDQIAKLLEVRRTDNETGYIRRLINRFG
ncbi:MAG: 1-acyl-sn-glycerol-3-phosphate acyltransferase [Hyphomicrobiaceae bacterium]